MISDPIADLLARIKNGSLSHADQMVVPYSQVKLALVKILKDNQFLKDYQITGEKPCKQIVVSLLYEDGNPIFANFKRVSKPGIRVYQKAKNLFRFSGQGITILSTPQGLLTSKEARKKGLGGEVLCKIW